MKYMLYYLNFIKFIFIPKLIIQLLETPLFVFVDAGSSGSRMNFPIEPDCKIEDKDVAIDDHGKYDLDKAVKLKYIFDSIGPSQNFNINFLAFIKAFKSKALLVCEQKI